MSFKINNVNYKIAWRCLYCKPKSCEKVKLRLEEAGIEVFYPIIEEKRKINGKIVYKYKELFPNYLFAKFSLKEYRLVKYTRGVSKVLTSKSEELAVVPEEIIKKIKSQMSNGYVHLKKSFQKGAQVKITEGPFKDMEAIFLEEVKPHERVIILLNTINNQIKMEVDVHILENAAPESSSNN